MYRLYHNPRCSKSRIALQMVEQSNHECEVIRYLDNPLDESEISAIVNGLIGDYRDLIRKNESEFKQSGLILSEMSKVDVIGFISHNGRCMERPILCDGERYVIGRPSEKLSQLLA